MPQMIQANELRIGNWVLINENELWEWEPDDFSDFVSIDNIYTNVSPIPLTPEILDKAPIPVCGAKGDLIADMIDDKEIEFVHQYQNACFALTGEELKIEL